LQCHLTCKHISHPLFFRRAMPLICLRPLQGSVGARVHSVPHATFFTLISRKLLCPQSHIHVTRDTLPRGSSALVFLCVLCALPSVAGASPGPVGVLEAFFALAGQVAQALYIAACAAAPSRISFATTASSKSLNRLKRTQHLPTLALGSAFL